MSLLSIVFRVVKPFSLSYIHLLWFSKYHISVGLILFGEWLYSWFVSIGRFLVGPLSFIENACPGRIYGNDIIHWYHSFICHMCSIYSWSFCQCIEHLHLFSLWDHEMSNHFWSQILTMIWIIHPLFVWVSSIKRCIVFPSFLIIKRIYVYLLFLFGIAKFSDRD